LRRLPARQTLGSWPSCGSQRPDRCSRCLAPADARDHFGDMLDRRLGRDAMAEIEDQRSAAEMLQDRIDALRERLTAGNQPKRVEIALHRALGLQALRLAEGHRPVKAQRRRTGLLPVAFVKRTGATWKTDDRHVGVSRSQL